MSASIVVPIAMIVTIRLYSARVCPHWLEPVRADRRQNGIDVVHLEGHVHEAGIARAQLASPPVIGFHVLEKLDRVAGRADIGDQHLGARDTDEVLEEFANEPERPLNEHLKAAVENREAHARWADHWSSG